MTEASPWCGSKCSILRPNPAASVCPCVPRQGDEMGWDETRWQMRVRQQGKAPERSPVSLPSHPLWNSFIKEGPGPHQTLGPHLSIHDPGLLRCLGERAAGLEALKRGRGPWRVPRRVPERRMLNLLIGKLERWLLATLHRLELIGAVCFHWLQLTWSDANRRALGLLGKKRTMDSEYSLTVGLTHPLSGQEFPLGLIKLYLISYQMYIHLVS